MPYKRRGAMSDEPFVMLSLKGDKAKKLAHALTNKSADKILAFLANKKDATESQIAKSLKLPVSTVNYTMKVLVEAKLVVAEEYHYSEKGREVNHFKLAKKYIIIAPDDEDEGFFQRMKKYVPAFAVTIGVAGVFKLFQGAAAGMTSQLSDMNTLGGQDNGDCSSSDRANNYHPEHSRRLVPIFLTRRVCVLHARTFVRALEKTLILHFFFMWGKQMFQPTHKIFGSVRKNCFCVFRKVSNNTVYCLTTFT
jgi:DNA-binding transcriptional ArsR family regulator